MNVKLYSIPGAMIIIIAMFSSCQKNTRPNANLVSDSSSFVGDTVILDASASTDAENDSLTYHWLVIEKPVKAEDDLYIIDPAAPLFIPASGGSYTIQLFVHDGTITSDTISATIEVIDYHGRWAIISREPWPANAIETRDTITYNEDGTVEWQQHYKVGTQFKLLWIGKGKQDSPIGMMEWTEMMFTSPPNIAGKILTKDNDLYDILKNMNKHAKDYHTEGVYFLSDKGNTLTIMADANKDGDYDDFTNNPPDGKTVCSRIK